MTEKQPLKVYYNSACPVCNAGIEWQKGKDSTCRIQWNDVHADNQLVTEIDEDLEIVRERLHVVDENGQLTVGFDAFLTIWRAHPRERWKAKVLGLPFIKTVCRKLYNLFAARLYRWNKSKKHW
jgi:predicted DCC family thiol-disulfide oxidoreductase YuxK